VEAIFLPLLLVVVSTQVLIHGSKIIISLVLLLVQKYQKPVCLWWKPCGSGAQSRFGVTGTAFNIPTQAVSLSRTGELDKATLDRVQEVTKLPEKDKDYIFVTLDALIRDFKNKYAYAK